MKLLSEVTIVLTLLRFAISLSLPFVDDVGNLVYDAVKLAIDGATEVTGQSVNISDVSFYLYTSNDNESANNLIDTTNPTQLSQAKSKIYFFIHGWTQSRESTPWYTPLTQILLKKSPDAFVIQIDWSKPAGQNYPFAAFATESVGNIVGDFIYKLVKDYNIPSINIVCIGHSLGSQALGWTGKRYFEISKSKLYRIIGLDPAGPLFRLRPDDRKLNKNDAHVVMAVHTDEILLGYTGKCGTIDFFPNFGSNQPGCTLNFGNFSSIRMSIFCSHRRAFDYFPFAVQFPQFFIAKKCANYIDFENNNCENVEVSLGDLETTQTGDFYLVTTGQPPYFNTSNENTVKTSSRARNNYQLNTESVAEESEI